MAPTCRWTPTRASRPRSPAAVTAGLAEGPATPSCSGLVAPAIAYGDSGEHQSFPGTISIGTEALSTLLLEYGRSATCWAQRLVFVNGHGGNITALRPGGGPAAVRRTRRRLVPLRGGGCRRPRRPR